MTSISLTKRLSYGAADTAGQLVFCVISFYLLYFYTDVYGISLAAAGTILLIARIIDALDAPIWGIIFDKTNSRWGKSRPWFLWLCVPFATFGVLTFLTPDLGHTAKVWYAAITYIVCSILFTGINTPLTTILPALTPNPKDWMVLICYRMYGSKLGVLIVNLTALRMVAWLGQGDDQKGFMLTMPIYATGTVLLFLLAFRNLKEVVKEENKPMPIKAGFRALRGNWPWMIVFASSMCFWIAFIARISCAPYFFEYILHRKDLVSIANSFDFVSLLPVLFLARLCSWTSKRNIWIAGLVGMVVGQLVIFLGVRYGGSTSVILAGWAFGFMLSGLVMPMPLAVLPESVNYGEWKTGVRALGLLTTIGFAFCFKASSGLGGALPAWIMAAHGYVPGVAQSADSLTGIEISFIWLPAVFFALAGIPVLFYKKFESQEAQIRAELDGRRGLSAQPDASA